MTTSSNHRPLNVTVSVCGTLSARNKSLRSPSDPSPQTLIGKINTFGRHERRRLPQAPHVLIAAGKERAKLRRRKTKQTLPVRNKRSIREMACEIGERTQIASQVQILSGRHQHARGPDYGIERKLSLAESLISRSAAAIATSPESSGLG